MSVTNCVLLVGPICSGKTKLAEMLNDRGFTNHASNHYSIENSRRNLGNGLMSGEMFAWGDFLQAIEMPPSNDNAVYEFSGTGKNNYNVSESMGYAAQKSGARWLVVYCLAPTPVLLERLKDKVYDAPCPYTFDNPKKSIDFMNQDLKGSWDTDWVWNRATKLKFNMNVTDYSEIADEIIGNFN